MLILGAIFTGLIIVFILSILIIVHESGHFIAARCAGVRVEKFALGFGKKLFGIKRGNTEYAVNLIPFGGFVKMAGEDPDERKGGKDEFQSKPIRSRFFIVVSGAVFNYVFAFLLFIVIFFIGTPMPTSEIGGTLKASPAELAGLRKGDIITAIDGKTIKYWDELVKTIRADTGGLPLSLTIERGDRAINLNVAPKVIETQNIFKQKVKFVGIGIAQSENVVILKGNPTRAVSLAAKHVWFFTVTTYKGIWLLATGAMPVKENVGGPILIVEMLAKAVKYGPVSVLNMLATISLLLALFNLLPFPILDGGHILFLGIEKLRGRPLSPRTQEAVQNVALVLLIMFFLYVSYFDTARVISNLTK